jgi:hypothetical protein
MTPRIENSVRKRMCKWSSEEIPPDTKCISFKLATQFGKNKSSMCLDEAINILDEVVESTKELREELINETESDS